LNNLVDNKRKEADHERLTAAEFRSRAAEKERLALAKESEAKLWRDKVIQVEHQKSVEILANDEFNRSKLQ